MALLPKALLAQPSNQDPQALLPVRAHPASQELLAQSDALYREAHEEITRYEEKLSEGKYKSASAREVKSIGKTAVTQGRDSIYTSTAISFGARLSRHNWEVYQAGEQTITKLYGLGAIADSQHNDTHSLVALNHPHGSVEQLHKCIVDGKAHCVFNGRIAVAQQAQLTSASQLNRNLLLSDRARVDTKPQLEIVADNVKCAHGATVSQLEADEIFYLQSRGINAAQAQRLLIYAFAMEILETMAVPSLRSALTEEISRWT